MPNYSCEKCGKKFYQKNDYTKHMNRKLVCNGTNVSEKLINLEKKIDQIEQKIGHTPIGELSKIENDNININTHNIMEVLANFCEENDIKFNIPKTELQELCDKLKIKYIKKDTKIIIMGKLEKYFTENPDKLTVEFLLENGLEKNIKKPKKKKETAIESPDEEKEEEFEEIAIDESDIDEVYNNHIITNREDLKDKIHEIHNYLRNGGVAFGMGALNIFNLLYGLARIEKFGLIEKAGLDEKCRFSTIKNIEMDVLCKKVFDIVEIIQNNSINNIYKSIACDIPTNISANILKNLIKDIELLLDSENRLGEQLAGKIYEYFIGRDKSAISDLGAYFTNRHIVNYIYNLIKPQLIDGGVPTMIDMFGGSGGFTLGYIQFINNNYNINWSENINNVHHFDMNPDVVRYAGLEILCMTKEIPDMDNCIKCENSFTYDSFKKYKYIITNPPYGGDKDNTKSTCIKTLALIDHLNNIINDDVNNSVKETIQLIKEKKKMKEIKMRKTNQKVSVDNSSEIIKKYCENNKLQKKIYKDKESVSLILMMSLLDKGGVAVGVLKEGIFFDSKYSTLRKHLVEKFNVKLVIGVPQNQFENTSTKTSIIIFENTEKKTTDIEFRELNVVKYEDNVIEEINNEWVVTQLKDDIKELKETVIGNANLEDLKKTNYSFNGKQYNLKEIIPKDGFKMVKLGDIVDFNKKGKKLDNIKEFKLVKIGDINKSYINTYTKTKSNNIKDSYIGRIGDILISTVRPKRGKNIILTETINELETYAFTLDKISIKKKCKIYPMYLFGYISILADDFEKIYCTGSQYPRFNINVLGNLKIPIPESDESMKYWVDRISKSYNEKLEKTNILKQKEQEIKNEIRRIMDEEDCDSVELGSICKILCGKNLPKEEAINGIYNVYGGGNSSYKHNEYNLEGFNIIVSRVGNNSVTLVNEKFYLTDNGFSLIVSNDIKKYFGYYILNNKEKIVNAGNGSAQKVISKKKLLKIKIKIPRNKSLIDNLEPIFQEIEQLKYDIKKSEDMFDDEIKNLRKASILE